ncbi:ribbon-helix-helix protein, CopG family [Nostoc sp. ChiVER01]|nr:ribbon-helix-helix protein, CopG family [Nostoc sp. ChiVER01]MDZ8221854.1 ribbon-helix-helix protein, CopG family [Nostoc sp. ChiVER01]
MKVRRQDAQQTLRLSTDTQTRLIALGDKRQQPISEIIRDAIAQYLENNN